MTSLVRVLTGLALLSALTACGEDRAVDPTTAGASTSGATKESTEASTPASTAPVSVTLYDADFTVDEAGRMTVVETLTLDVTTDDRHGILRYFTDDDAVEGFDATLDGASTPIEESGADDQVTYRVGDPDRTLARGAHVVRMTYDVPDVLDEGRFEWDLVPGEWDLPIGTADLTVHLPTEVTDATCTVGTEPCDVTGLGSDELRISVVALGDHVPVQLGLHLD